MVHGPDIMSALPSPTGTNPIGLAYAENDIDLIADLEMLPVLLIVHRP
jgi:hypothetical protein